MGYAEKNKKIRGVLNSRVRLCSRSLKAQFSSFPQSRSAPLERGGSFQRVRKVPKRGWATRHDSLKGNMWHTSDALTTTFPACETRRATRELLKRAAGSDRGKIGRRRDPLPFGRRTADRVHAGDRLALFVGGYGGLAFASVHRF